MFVPVIEKLPVAAPYTPTSPHPQSSATERAKRSRHTTVSTSVLAARACRRAKVPTTGIAPRGTVSQQRAVGARVAALTHEEEVWLGRAGASRESGQEREGEGVWPQHRERNPHTGVFGWPPPARRGSSRGGAAPLFLPCTAVDL